MDGLDAVLDSPDTGMDDFAEQPETQVDPAAPPADPAAPPADNIDDPYSSKASKEYASFLKNLRDADPGNAKYARLAKDDHSKLYQLHQLEPKGLDGVRERYAMLDSLMHGEKTGPEALSAMQDELTRMQQVDERLMSGDVSALDDMGEDFNQKALPAMVGPILDRVREANYEAYSRAILPHFVEALKSSELVTNFNGLVDVLDEKPPSWLTPDQRPQWINERLQRVLSHATRMGEWFTAQQQKSQSLGGTKAPSGPGAKQGDPLTEERQKFEQERTEHHWNTNIKPSLDKFASDKFKQEFGPYQQRLKLDAIALGALKREYSSRVAKAAVGNPNYSAQIGRYRAQKNPDAATVLNFAKVEFNKHSKSVMDALVNERYKPFLTSGRQQATPPPAAGATPPAGSGIKMVPVKPAQDQINFKGTPLAWMRQGKYRMNDGSVVQVARQ